MPDSFLISEGDRANASRFIDRHLKPFLNAPTVALLPCPMPIVPFWVGRITRQPAASLVTTVVSCFVVSLVEGTTL